MGAGKRGPRFKVQSSRFKVQSPRSKVQMPEPSGAQKIVNPRLEIEDLRSAGELGWFAEVNYQKSDS
jgi:hypothetical protein